MNVQATIASKMPFGRLANIGTIGSLATCYAKIVSIALIGIGFTALPDINPHVQAAIMTIFALAAAVGLFWDRARHQRVGALIVGVAGVALIVGTLYGYYMPELEFTGYLLLVVAVFLNQNFQLKNLHQIVVSMNTELAERAEEAEQATEAKSRFLASMSHELRTPLNSIIGISEMLHEEAADEGSRELVEAHERIVRAAKHLLSLVDDILDLSRIEAGRVELEMQRIDIAELMRDVEVTVRPLAEKRGDELEMVCDAGIGTMQADPLRLRQVIINLAGNACKFTENGRVTIEALREAPAERSGVRFVVRDSGIGIPPEDLQRIFEEFSQVQGTRGAFGGTGLGLTISRRLCNLMGGDITAESTPGRGSTFTVRLPA